MIKKANFDEIKIASGENFMLFRTKKFLSKLVDALLSYSGTAESPSNSSFPQYLRNYETYNQMGGTVEKNSSSCTRMRQKQKLLSHTV